MFIQQCLKKLQMFSLLNKTQSKSLILALFIACSLETTSTVPETTTSSIELITNTTTSEVNEDLALQNFQLAWEETLNEPIILSDFEKELTAYLFELWKWKGDKWTPEKENFYELKINGLSCYRIWNAMGSAWLDEVHPIQDNYSKGYWAVERYTCEEDSIYGMGPSLFGAPFYYQDTWWIYQKFEFNWNMVDCKNPCGYGNNAFATRVAIDLDDEIYSVVTPKYPKLIIKEISDEIPEYDRNDWNHWVDYDNDCQNVRHEVLQTETKQEVTFTDDTECFVDTGKWYGLYTGEYYYYSSDLDIDHLVPLKNAHISGGWNWSNQKKEDFANYLVDESHLIAVQSGINRSKGSKSPDEWKPNNIDYWCEYAYDWIRIKNNWELTATQAEWDALLSMIETCPENFTYKDANN